MMGYNIVHYTKENEYAIKKEIEWADPKRLSNYNKEWVRTYKEQWAKRFFHEDEATSALALIKIKWNIKDREPDRPDVEKQSWDELS